MPKSNITGLIEHGKVRTEITEKKVMATLNTLRREGETINIAKVAKLAGVSPNFIYTHEDILKTIRKYSNNPGVKKVQTQDAKDVLINSLRSENRDLKQKIKKLESEERYKDRCRRLEKEIEQLKKEVENALLNSDDFTY